MKHDNEIAVECCFENCRAIAPELQQLCLAPIPMEKSPSGSLGINQRTRLSVDGRWLILAVAVGGWSGEPTNPQPAERRGCLLASCQSIPSNIIIIIIIIIIITAIITAIIQDLIGVDNTTAMPTTNSNPQPVKPATQHRLASD